MIPPRADRSRADRPPQAPPQVPSGLPSPAISTGMRAAGGLFVIAPVVLLAALMTFALVAARNPLPGGGLGPVADQGAKLALVVGAGVVSLGSGVAWALGRPRSPGAATRLLAGVVLLALAMMIVLAPGPGMDGTTIGVAVVAVALVASAFAFDPAS